MRTPGSQNNFMNIEQYRLNQLKLAVEGTFGRTPGSPSDFDNLSYQILSYTNDKLGVSTLKRFWGYVKSSHKPTYTTLSVLARYAGYRDWDAFCAQIQNEQDSGFSTARLLIAANLNLKSIVHAEWSKEKWLQLRKIEQPDRFEVLKSNNIKLIPGDTLNLNILNIGEKFIATDCSRDGASMGTYIGARREGISAIKIINLGHD